MRSPTRNVDPSIEDGRVSLRNVVTEAPAITFAFSPKAGVRPI